MTPPLGDFFPKANRERHCDSLIKAGAVFRMSVPHTNPPKIKRFAVIGVSDDRASVGILFINSEINPALFPSTYLKSLHFPLPSEDRPYIEHDSFLDCSQLYEMDFQILKEHCVADVGVHIGETADTDFEKIKNLAASATTIETKKKRKYGFFM